MDRRIGPASVLAAALLSGVAGCAALPGFAPLPAGPSAGTGGDGKTLDLPGRTVYNRGDAADPSAATTTGAPVRGPIASMSPLTSPAYPTATPTSPPSESPTECTGSLQAGMIYGVDVTPGTTSATVSWWNIGDPAITQFRVAAVSQQLFLGMQPEWTWQSVPVGKGCTRVTTTVTGLTSQVPYVFVVVAVLKRYDTLPPAAPEVARSIVVRTL